MAKLKLSDRLIQALEYDESDYVYWDKQFNGGAFGVRLSPGGTKAFVLKYRTLDGRQRWMSLGAYPAVSLADARKAALKALASVAEGEDPAEERIARRRAITFGDLWELYLERHAKAKKRSWMNDQRMAEHDLLPAWRTRKVADITRVDVVRVLDAVCDRGSPVMANRTKALISKIFAFAVARSIREDNPAHGVARPHKEQPRDRVLSRDEIKALWKAIEDLPMLTAATYKLRLLTAQRGQEVYMMKWSDVSGDTWVIPAENAKNGRKSTVFLSRQSIAVLDELRAITGDGEYVFPGRDKSQHIQPRGCTATTLRRATGIDFTPHDLRRTAAHYMAEHLNVRQSVISSILNHVAQDITAKHYTVAEWHTQKRRAMSMWGSYLEAIVNGEPESNIVEFPAQA